MHLFAKSCLITAVLTASLSLCGQEQQRFSGPNLLARLSFDNSSALQSQRTRHICIAVDRDGSYRMMRGMESLRWIPRLTPDWIERLETQRLEGTMSQEQLLQFKALLESADFRSLSGNHGGLIRQSAEIFAAEIPVLGKQVSDGTLHVQWLNGDGESPFPPPVNKIVDWLNRFEPVNAKPLVNLEFQDVCPSVGLQLLQPTVASNMP